MSTEKENLTYSVTFFAGIVLLALFLTVYRIVESNNSVKIEQYRHSISDTTGVNQ